MKARAWLVPEVVQTSAMDCGPACLSALAAGFGGRLSYGRLREACQTDVDGTSIDTLEDVGQRLGLDVQQVLVPVDSVLDARQGHLPCVTVVLLPDGSPHFVVLWRRLGPWVQVMDPAVGRRWVRAERLARELYVHEMPLDAAAWLAWARGPGLCGPLERRLRELGVRDAAQRVERARDERAGRGLATLDAALRTLAALRASIQVRRDGAHTGALLDDLLAAAQAAADPTHVLPATSWSAREQEAAPAANGTHHAEPTMVVRGAVLLRASRFEPAGVERAALAPELLAALDEAPPRPAAHLVAALVASGKVRLAALVLGLALAALGVTLEGLLFAAAIDVRAALAVRAQVLAAVAALLAWVVLSSVLEWPLASLVQGTARSIELRLRAAFLDKLPRLAPRVLASRPISDLAERAHAIWRLRELAPLGAGIVRILAEVAVLGAGLAWIAPHARGLVLAFVLVAALPPLFLPRLLRESDLRARTHEGALARFHLDVLMGGLPLRTHGAQAAMRAEHEALLVHWARAARAGLAANVSFAALHGLLVHVLAAGLVARELTQRSDPAGALLLVLWTLTVVWLSEPLAHATRALPTLRNTTLRLLEPLAAPEEDAQGAPAATLQPAQARAGVAIELRNVSVRAGGHDVLDDVSLSLRAGEQVAIVGASGAGKSSLCGLLLGWHAPSKGQVLVDGVPLDGARLRTLRRATAWVDPSVQLFNRSLAGNLRYGSEGPDAADLGELCETARLNALLPRLPEGLHTLLGESGALLSGGEGQRVRAARALGRRGVRLVVLDEALRGLDLDARRGVLGALRARNPGATLLHVTHRIEEALAFARVLVIDGGRVVEDGDPRALAHRRGSRLAQLLERERESDALWGDARWKRLVLERGLLTEASA